MKVTYKRIQTTSYFLTLSRGILLDPRTGMVELLSKLPAEEKLGGMQLLLLYSLPGIHILRLSTGGVVVLRGFCTSLSSAPNALPPLSAAPPFSLYLKSPSPTRTELDSESMIIFKLIVVNAGDAKQGKCSVNVYTSLKNRLKLDSSPIK